MKKDSFEKKLAAYVAMSAAYLVAHPVDANAQIMYTDVMPDDTIQNSFFNLDLNNDGVVDFKLEHEHQLYFGYGFCYTNWAFNNYANPLNSSNQILNESSGYPLPVNISSQIGNATPPAFNSILQRHYGGICLSSSTTGSSTWTNTFPWAQTIGNFGGNDKLFGLSINSGGNTYYGWARLDVTDDHIILKDYAINTIPDSSILAGNGGSGCTINNIFLTPSGHYWMCDDSVSIQLSNINGLNVQWMNNYSILTGENDSVYTVHEPGFYQALVSDSNCSALINAVTVDTVAFSIDQSFVQIARCENPNGHIGIHLTGTSPGYTYMWSNGATTHNLDYIPAGNYSVTVYSTACSSVDSVTADFVVNTSPAVTLSAVYTDTVCNSNGTIDLTVDSGTAPYTYHWSNFSNFQDLANLTAGNYTVTVEDYFHCTASQSFQIYSNSFTLSDSHVASCVNTGSIDLSISQGQPPFNFFWSNGVTNEDLNGLPPGNYTVTVTDANNCTMTHSAQIANYSILLSSNYDPTCDSSGLFDITVSQGHPPYTFLWSNGATVEDISNLIPGIYSVTVSDVSGCTSFVSANILQLPVPHPPIFQFGNILTAGLSPNYQWYLNGTLIPGATQQQYVASQSGSYTVEVTNTSGCHGFSDAFDFVFNSINELSQSEIEILVDDKQLHVLNSALIGAQIDIVNELGQLAASVTVTNQTPSADLSALPGGIYFYHIRSRQKTYSGKFIIE